MASITLIPQEVRIRFTPIPSYSRMRRRTFAVRVFLCARRKGKFTKIRLRTANGKPHGSTGKPWYSLHCQEPPEEIRTKVKEARQLFR